MKTILRRLSVVLIPLLFAGCGPLDLGGNGLLHFSDETTEPGFNIRLGIHRKIAKGAQLNMVVSEPNIKLSQVRSDAPDILSVESTETIERDAEDEAPESQTRIKLQSHAVGTTRIHVDLEDGTTDYIELTVAESATNEMELYPWHDLVALDPSLWASGIKLLPETNLTIFGRARGTDGRSLTGAKSADWLLDTAGDASISELEDSDFIVYHSGSVVGENGISLAVVNVKIYPPSPRRTCHESN